MRCDKCNSVMRVVKTMEEDQTVYRRRKCKNCKNIAFTVEEVVIDNYCRYKLAKYDLMRREKYKQK